VDWFETHGTYLEYLHTGIRRTAMELLVGFTDTGLFGAHYGHILVHALSLLHTSMDVYIVESVPPPRGQSRAEYKTLFLSLLSPFYLTTPFWLSYPSRLHIGISLYTS
jgi:hypothetical protein